MAAAPFATFQGRNQLELRIGDRWVKLTQPQMQDILTDLVVRAPQPVHEALVRIQRAASRPEDVPTVRAWLEQMVLEHIPA